LKELIAVRSPRISKFKLTTHLAFDPIKTISHFDEIRHWKTGEGNGSELSANLFGHRQYQRNPAFWMWWKGIDEVYVC